MAPPVLVIVTSVSTVMELTTITEGRGSMDSSSFTAMPSTEGATATKTQVPPSTSATRAGAGMAYLDEKLVTLGMNEFTAERAMLFVMTGWL
ncbi:hypothetical protein N431DRAFT_473900 [Stipitochalara longipes BDJ]|nr:hypothetical protein N431DRAFT_473900 [Stipitochalara longipes BDJ]